MPILSSVKKSLGITDSMTHFDDVIMMHINTVFVILNQMGVGPEEVFTIEDNYSYWDDFSDDKNTGKKNEGDFQTGSEGVSGRPKSL